MNHADRVRHGTEVRGVQHPGHRLTEDDVRAIRARAADGESRTSIAVDYPVSQGTVSRIVRRVKWRHVP
jgi:hypothetical protein